MDEEIKTQRKQWQKPELIVLVRSKPEEAILLGCKYDVGNGPTRHCNTAPRCVLNRAS
jgi:hypothetical protein